MSENVLGVAGLLVGLLGIGVGIVTYFRMKERKQLDFEVIVNAPLIGAAARTVRQDLEVHFRGLKVDDPHLIIARFLNTGNRPIAPDDQIEPISIDFSESEGRPVTADIVKMNIPNAVVPFTIQESTISLTPLLFNEEDWIAVRIVVDGKSSPVAQGRITGVKAIGPYKAP